MLLARILFDENYQFAQLLKVRNFLENRKIRFLPVIIKFLLYRVGHCVIHINAKIGRVKFAHPVGVVIGEGVIIDNNVTIFQQVTIGGRGGVKVECKKYPIIEDNVIIYAGAKVIGGITVGCGSIIGANAVVIKDVPPKSLVVGIPGENRRLN